MGEQWRKGFTRAFTFWQQFLTALDQGPRTPGQFGELIAHLKRLESRTAPTFQYVVERGADPVYILGVLILLCDEAMVRGAVGVPRVASQTKAATFPDQLGDFHCVTESELRKLDAALPAYEQAGIAVDQTLLTHVRRQIEALPAPPPRPGYRGEKAIFHTTFRDETPPPPPRRGRPGEHYFNTAMVLLARHLRRPAPQGGARYGSIALLLNAFCPATYEGAPLNRETVRQRIRAIEPRVQEYCRFFEEWFATWKATLRRQPVPFYPWLS